MRSPRATRPAFPDQASLAEHMNGWEQSESVAGGVSYALRVARALMVQSYVTYDFALPAVTWAMLALKQCLAGCVSVVSPEPLPENAELGYLIGRARRSGLISKQAARVLHRVRILRNDIVHGDLDPTFPPGTAVDMLQGLHEAISDIYTRAAAMSGSEGAGR